MTSIDELLDTARADVERGWIPSCQLAVARDGALVAFETFGTATNSTRYCIFSCTKPIVASAVWLLIGEGRLDPARRVTDYIPEFAANGKDAVTVEQVMLHTAGFPNAVVNEVVASSDAERRAAAFAKWELEWEPGTRFEYHGTSAHWVLVDLIERLGGVDFRDYIEQRVTTPLGLPRLLGIAENDQADVASLVTVGDVPLDGPIDSALLRLNRPEVRAAGVPGSGAIMRAADLALFYQGLLHNPNGLWDASVLDDAKTNVRCNFPDNLLQVPVNRTLGLVLAGDDGQHFMRYGSFGVANSPRSIGHAGAHMHIGWGDPETGISFAYCTNGLDNDVMKEGARGVNLSGIAAALDG
jgi:CubicO group peptidase (beta-lactamase class C family)